MTVVSRRSALMGMGAATILSTVGTPRMAYSETSITAVEWGGDVIEAMKQIAADQSETSVNWVLHQGGAGALFPKIAASWPDVEYDYVAGWEGSIPPMAKENWLVPVTLDLVPNLKDIPEQIIIKDADGNWLAVPRAVGGIYWGYRPDTSPIEITGIDDLFDPQLKGKVCWPGPSQSMMLQIVALARHAGGDERNMEPGWELMKELARSGAIGRVTNTDTDFSTSITSGETVVGFFAEPGWAAVAKDFPVVRLNKQENMLTILYQSAFAVLQNRPNLDATFAFINHAISPEMCTLYAEVSGEAPLNVNSVAPERLAHLQYTAQEMADYIYPTDIEYVLTQQNDWAMRWESEIAPLL